MDNTEETDYSDDSDEVGVNVNNTTSDRSKNPLFDVTIE
jgi:hypothetical protein